PEGGEADFTVEFQLRKSIHRPRSGDAYDLRPTLRLVDNVHVGHLRGTVGGGYVADRCSGGAGNGLAVYVYAGANQTPVDVDGAEPDPVTSARAELDNGSGDYAYAVGYLPKGSYTVAFTCNAKDDDPGTKDDIGLLDAANVEVTAGETATHDFSL
ncbi:MAG TPA: DUF4382 domain-containing protein, partial [Gammaproteobacteria bacterium]|nr:DUF4382 domain-containing protein [Gammaproteobacteria bacterium]